jgi:trans-aconitate methyltransferase
MISKAKWRSSKIPNVEFHVGDVMTFAVDQPFDYVVSMAAIYYVFPMEALAPRIRQLCVPGGWFAAGTFD